MKLLAAALVACGAVGGCAHPTRPGGAPALDALLGFSNPAMCYQSHEHERFLRAMIGGDANDGFRAGRIVAPPGLRSAFRRIEVAKHDGWWEIGVPVVGTMFGLPVTRIMQSLPEGGDPGDVIYTFAKPVAEVERVLRARGFPAKAGEDVQLGPPDGYAYIMLLRSETATSSLLSCGYS